MSRRGLGARGALCMVAGALVLACYLGAATVAALAPGLHRASTTLAIGTLLGSLAGIGAWVAAPRLRGPVAGSAAPPPMLAAAPRLVPPEPFPETDRLARRLRFDQQLQRAVDDAEDPGALAEVVERALAAVPLEEVAAEARAEWLQQGPRRKTLIQLVESGPDGEGPGCPVLHAGQCEAIRRNRTLRFLGTDIDSCRHLADREVPPASAVCTPVRLLGEAQGVLHRTASLVASPSDLEVSYLESIAAKTGARLSVLRLASDTAAEQDRGPATDTLTGLHSREALETAMRELTRTATPFALAQCDVDHFADYTKRYGPDAADDALRTLARAASRCLRPDDLLGRGGSDELLAVFPATTATAARRALERLREELLLELTACGQAPFTVSFGVIESSFGPGLDELLVQVDAATALAKQLGRNRAAVHGEATVDGE